MKTKHCLIAALLIAVAGCATPTFTPVQTPVVSTTQTPVVTVTPQGITNTVFVTTVTTNFVVQTVTNYVPNTTAQTVATTLQQVAPLVPAPFSFPIESAGYLLALIAAGVATYKNAKANQHLNTLQAVTAGIETSLPGLLAAPGMTPQVAQNALAAVKQSVTDATTSNNTQGNLRQVLSKSALS